MVNAAERTAHWQTVFAEQSFPPRHWVEKSRRAFWVFEQSQKSFTKCGAHLSRSSPEECRHYPWQYANETRWIKFAEWIQSIEFTEWIPFNIEYRMASTVNSDPLQRSLIAGRFWHSIRLPLRVILSDHRQSHNNVSFSANTFANFAKLEIENFERINGVNLTHNRWRRRAIDVIRHKRSAWGPRKANSQSIVDENTQRNGGEKENFGPKKNSKLLS